MWNRQMRRHFTNLFGVFLTFLFVALIFLLISLGLNNRSKLIARDENHGKPARMLMLAEVQKSRDPSRNLFAFS